MQESVTLGVAFIAGFLSFFSPCTLPLLPTYLCYLSGVKLAGVKSGRAKVFLNAVMFVVGFGVVFTLLGTVAGFLGSFFPITKIWTKRLGGAVILLFGLYMLHVIKIPWLDKQEKIVPHFHKFNLLTSFVFGATFALGWTPCTTPVTTSILMLAAGGGSINWGTILLASYTLGLAIPFLVLGGFVRYFIGYVSHEHKYMRYIYILSGAFLVIVGVMTIFGKIDMVYAILR